MIYLDAAATSKVDKRLSKIIYDTMDCVYGNPSSNYALGRDARLILDKARIHMNDFLGVKDDGSHLIFTGSGSEANTLALTGFDKWCKSNHLTCSIYSSTIEHKSIINQPCVTSIIAVDENGLVDIDMIDKILSYNELMNNYTIISVQFANNEIGTIQNVQEIGEHVHKYRGGIFHCDATQALPWCYKIISDTKVDIITGSFHKSGMPKGIGFAWFRDGIKVDPIVYGGQQNWGMHGGTENIPYISAIPRLTTILVDEFSLIYDIDQKRDYLWTRILEEIEDVRLNGSTFDNRLPNNLNISFAGVDGEGLLAQLDRDGIYVSAGSACNSNSVEPSYVLEAIGCPDDYIYGAIRITLSKDTTTDELDQFVERLKVHVKSQRELFDIDNN